MKVKYLTQEHNTRSLASAQTQTTCSGFKRTNHEAPMPPTINALSCTKNSWPDSRDNFYEKILRVLITI